MTATIYVHKVSLVFVLFQIQTDIAANGLLSFHHISNEQEVVTHHLFYRRVQLCLPEPFLVIYKEICKISLEGIGSYKGWNIFPMLLSKRIQNKAQ